MADGAPGLARKMWRTLEPVHGMIYFVPEAAAAYERRDVTGRSGYFASRSAAMGAVVPEVVTATFFNFHPALVERAMRDVWDRTTPAAMVEARLEAAGTALTRILGAAVLGSPELKEAATLAREAAEACDGAGRPIAAAVAALPWPEPEHLVLWHAITVLREYRGDGHVAALVAAGLGGVEALVLHAASGEVPRLVLQRSRAWSDGEWADAVAGLGRRGLVHPNGEMTDEGRAFREDIEDCTDRLAAPPWRVLGEEPCSRLRDLVRPYSRAVVEAGTFSAGLPGLDDN
jgi:helix-turn-helix protein